MATIVMDIPELATHLASFVSISSLYSCVCVSSQWSETFIPYLWHTIDDHEPGWSRILRTCSHPPSKGHKDEAWVHAVFAKYGHLIRDLTVHWPFMVTVASQALGCRKLQSLRFRKDSDLTLVEEEERRARHSGTVQQGLTDLEILERPTVLLSPKLEGVFQSRLLNVQRMPPLRTSREEQEQDWIWTQHYWLLVMNNLSTLQRFHLALADYSHRAQLMPFSAPDFLYNGILRAMPLLTDLELGIYEPDFWKVMLKLPKLRKFAMDSHWTFNRIPGRPHALIDHTLAIRDLTLKSSIPMSLVHSILGELPQLERLGCGYITRTHDFQFNPSLPVESRMHHHLKELSISVFDPSDLYRSDDLQLAAIVRALPNLERLDLMNLGMQTAQALVAHCPRFECLLIRRGNTRIRYDAEIALRREWQGQRAIDLMLRICPRLRVLDAVEYYVHVDDLLFQTSEPHWQCQEHLEYLGIKILGLDRQDQCHEEAAVTAPKEPFQVNTVLDFVKRVESQGLCQDQHRQVYDRLSRLTNLRQLNLGYDARDQRNTSRAEVLFLNSNRKIFIYKPWQTGTLDLSLRNGLDMLGTLTKLEIFGFEGVDHCVRETELLWMGEHWPRLKIMYGLDGDEKAGVSMDKDRQRQVKFMKAKFPHVELRHSILDLKD